MRIPFFIHFINEDEMGCNSENMCGSNTLNITSCAHLARHPQKALKEL